MTAKKIFLAYPRGFCAGVRRAVDAVEMALRQYGDTVYVLHEIVHNEYVVNDLRSRGVIFVEDVNLVPAGSTLIFSAHGVPKAVELMARRRKLRVIDATCPLVKKIHRKAIKFREKGCKIVLIGHRGHPEIIGTMGQLDEVFAIVENAADVSTLPALRRGEKIAYLTQTTLSLDETDKIIAELQSRFPGILGGNDICYATQNRQNAVRALCEHCELILILGSSSSSNSNRLREVAEHGGIKAVLIDGVSALPPALLNGINRIGISAGASAPECLVERTVNLLKEHGWDEPQECCIIDEHVAFPLPDFKV
jgi:4-hydroxy-3-methylbut-2-enyl diphosphate reductase